MRKPRVHVHGGIYHVMLRGNNGQIIFQQAQDHNKFYEIIKNVLAKCDAKIRAYCLMQNHVHLVVEVGTDSISNIIQHLAGRYAVYFNKKYQRKGHLFQGRFKSILVHADKYFLILIRYIHQNPLRANLISSLMQPWPSSFHDYLGLKDVSWLTQELVLSYFNKKNEKPTTQFHEFMSIRQNKDEYLNLCDSNNLPEHQSTNDFFKLIHISENKYRITPICTISDIIQFCEDEMQIPRGEIMKRSEKHKIVQARKAAISLAFATKIATLKELSSLFKKNYSYLSRLMNQHTSKHYDGLIDLKNRLYERYNI